MHAVLNAALIGDRATLSYFVSTTAVRRRIMAFGTTVRLKGNISVHITPSFTLSRTNNGVLGAEFNVVGQTHGGNVKAPQTVYLSRRGGHQVIVEDQPDEEW